MKLTWTFYPKGETAPVTLMVVYVPELDEENISSGGFLVVHSNVAYVDWNTYKRFDTADIESRKDAFSRLTPLSEGDEFIRTGGKRITFPALQRGD